MCEIRRQYLVLHDVEFISDPCQHGTRNTVSCDLYCLCRVQRLVLFVVGYWHGLVAREYLLETLGLEKPSGVSQKMGILGGDLVEYRVETAVDLLCGVHKRFAA